MRHPWLDRDANLLFRGSNLTGQQSARSSAFSAVTTLAATQGLHACSHADCLTSVSLLHKLGSSLPFVRLHVHVYTANLSLPVARAGKLH